MPAFSVEPQVATEFILDSIGDLSGAGLVQGRVRLPIERSRTERDSRELRLLPTRSDRHSMKLVESVSKDSVAGVFPDEGEVAK